MKGFGFLDLLLALIVLVALGYYLPRVIEPLAPSKDKKETAGRAVSGPEYAREVAETFTQASKQVDSVNHKMKCEISGTPCPSSNPR